MRLANTKIIYGVLCLTPLWLSACGGGGGGSSAAGTTTVRSAYVANSGDGTISQYTIDATTGALKPMTAATVPSIAGSTTSSPYAITVDPAGKHVYVANSGVYDISQFTIGAGGALTPMTPATVLSGLPGSLPYAITVDPSGKYAYVANSGDNTVSQFTIDATTGALTAMTPATVVSGAGTWPGPVSVTVDAKSQYVYVVNETGNTISQYTIGVTGALTPMTPATVATGTNPVAVAVTGDATGSKYLYTVNYFNGAGGNSISQYTIGAGGALTVMTPATVTTGTLPTSIAIDPTGKYAYVANGLGVSQYTIGATGALTAMTIPSVAITGGFTPQSITVDAAGKYVYVACLNSNFVAQFSIGGGGALTAMTPTATVATGAAPNSIATAVSIQ